MGVWISRVKFRGFKSFKHADAHLARGFVCVAGPNGSGKSNVCDGLRFALGERSLRSLRADNVRKLISTSCRQAEVTVFIDGDAKHEVRRGIREDGKVKYLLDGKRVTRTALHEALRPYGFPENGHNIVAQGQVQKIVEMNGKERRGIIDAAAGIAEFEDKKAEALRELEKVQLKLNEASIVLAERTGVLNELEKEKNDAEKFLDAQARHRRARATLVQSELARVEKQHSDALAKWTELNGRQQELEAGIAKFDVQIKELEEKKGKLFAKLNERAGKDGLAQAIDDLKVAVQTDKNAVSDKQTQQQGVFSRSRGLFEERAKIEKQLQDLTQKVVVAQKEAAKIGKEADAFEREHKTGLADALGKNLGELKEKFDALSKNIEDWRAEQAKLEADCQRIKDVAGIKQAERTRLENQTGAGSLAERESKLAGERDTLSKDIKVLDKELEAWFTRERELNRELPTLDRQLLEVKEKLAIARASASPQSANQALLLVKQMMARGDSGVVGTVADLVSFDADLATAVEAAAGQRLQYVIVENLDAAEKAIESLKRNKAGRCTFIPLDRSISAISEDLNKLASGTNSDGFLIEHVKFDRRYHNAMNYVFGDTLLVEDVAAARKIGSGRARLVTYGGELLERSGVITGGTFKASLAARAAVEKLTKDEDAVKSERDGKVAELTSVRESMTKKRREKFELEIKMKGVEVELNGLSERSKASKELVQALTDLGDQVSRSEKEVSEKKSRLEKVVEAVRMADRDREALRLAINKAEEKSRSELTGAEKQMADLLARKAAKDGEVLAHQREADLRQERLTALASEIRGVEAETERFKKEISEAEKRIAKNEGELTLKQASLKEISAAVERLYTDMKKLEEQISALAQERGVLRFKRDGDTKTLTELQIRKETSETRLVDLKTEFASFGEIQLIEGESRDRLQAMERECSGIMASIPSPNLRAPELYTEKKRDIDDVKARLDKLAAEKQSVHNMIDEIDQKKRAIFLETFTSVNQQYQSLFGKIFKGESTLVLDTPSDPFNSGLSIRVSEPQHKRDRYLDSLSGGEKSLLALVFIFAIQMTKPAPFYILDEADAALDKENSRKLASLLKQLASQTQFIVVTHNDIMLSEADVALGVAKTPDGSRIVGVNLTHHAGQSTIHYQESGATKTETGLNANPASVTPEQSGLAPATPAPGTGSPAPSHVPSTPNPSDVPEQMKLSVADSPAIIPAPFPTKAPAPSQTTLATDSADQPALGPAAAYSETGEAAVSTAVSSKKKAGKKDDAAPSKPAAREEKPAAKALASAPAKTKNKK